MKPEMISFKLCPFVQRSVITLLEKGVDFDITYIDLANPPDWFKQISPMGQVPVLKVGDEVLFESAVIMEYLDEINPPSLHPADPLRKAKNRAWIEFGSGLFFCQFHLSHAKDESSFQKHHSDLCAKLAKVEAQLGSGPYFNGEEFTLTDAAYAPFFMRSDLLDSWHGLNLYEGLPKVAAWHQALLERPAVKDSVTDDFAELYRGRIAKEEGYATQLFCRSE